MRLTSLLCAAAAASALCACEPYQYGEPPPPGYYGPSGYYGAPGYSPGYYGSEYDDPCFDDASYCDYAYYEGPVWWGGAWYGGPHRWRETDGHREFWIRHGWHADVRLGDRGSWHGPGRWHPD